jgi:mono/diheme cytochrome c family protein
MKLLKKLLLGLVVLLVVVVGGGLAAFLALTPKQHPPSSEKVALTPERVARGRDLVEHVADCFGCHAGHDFSRWGGPVRKGTEGVNQDCLDESMGAPGTICFPNITPDPETGIGSWTDGEILRAIREGVGRKGQTLFPMMPYDVYRGLSDEDARSIVAYLRTLPPARKAVPRSQIQFPVNLMVRLAPQPVSTPIVAPDPSDTIAYGKYLAHGVAGCAFCHTPVDQHAQSIPGMLLAGGQEFVGPWGRMVSANITTDPTGIGPMTRENFIGLIRSFANQEEVAVPVAEGENTVMPWLPYAGMSESDLGAIYDYLRTVPPVHHEVQKWPRPQVAAAAVPAAAQ